jgi:hypothetical protein
LKKNNSQIQFPQWLRERNNYFFEISLVQGNEKLTKDSIHLETGGMTSKNAKSFSQLQKGDI